MAPMGMSLDLTAQLAAVLWGMVAALGISGIGLIACTDASNRIRRACVALVSRARIRLAEQYVEWAARPKSA